MAGQMIGTVISASMGSTDARNDLKEIVPFYSWLLLGEKIDVKWQAQDYYGAGKEAWNLALQVVGDVTIFFPVVKGTAAGIKMVGQQMKLVFQQGTKKLGQSFGREAKNVMQQAASPDEVKTAIKRCATGINCFPAGTLVLMAGGELKPINRVRAGEYVLADDPADSEPSKPQLVEEVVQNWTRTLHDIQTDRDTDGVADASFSSTGEHPFWTVERGWTNAQDLQSGDHLLAPDHTTVTVTANTPREQNKTRTWNLTVANAHSFYVVDADSAVLVHNVNPGPKHWIVYIAPLKSDPNRYYVGIASKPASGSIDPLEVLRYRAGPAGSEHHKHIMGHIDGSKIKIRGDWWAEGKMDGKWIARGIEDHIHDYLVANNMHDPTQRKPISDGSKGSINPLRTQYRNAGQNSEMWNKVIKPRLPCQ